MNMGTLYEKILASLERFLLVIAAWYEGKVSQRAETSLATTDKLSEAIKEKNTIIEQVKGMTREEKIKIAVSDE